MKLEQKWYSAARGTLFAAVLLLCLAGGIRGGLGLVFLPWELLRQPPLGGLNCAISAVPTVGASSCPGFLWRRPNTAAPAASTFLGSSTAGGKRGTKQPTHFSRYKKEEVQMSFEAEVIPLFIGGVIAVSAIEFFLGWRSLRHRKDLRGLFAGHVVAMLLGFFFLIRSLFANWLGLSLGIASISNSVNIGLFGLCWAVSALCVAVMLSRLAAVPRY